MNEIDLFKDLKRVEDFLNLCRKEKKEWSDAEKDTKIQISAITKEIKEKYPDLNLNKGRKKLKKEI